MPIRPENRDRYPPSWREISARIRNERAGGRCECTGECGTNHADEAAELQIESCSGEPFDRCRAFNGGIHPVTGSRVVLTVAHLPGREIEQCGDDDLRAMCQRCHNKMDMPERRRGIRERLRTLMAIGDLFKGG